MKRTILAVLAAVLAVSALAAQGEPVGRQAWTGTLELGTTISRLAELAGNPAQAAAAVKGKAFLLVGTLGKPISGDTEPFSAVAPFQEGVWTGTSSVGILRIYLRFSGDEFAEFAGSVKGVRAVALLDSGELAPAPDGGMALFFRVVSIRVVE